MVELLRCGNRKAVQIPDQQFRALPAFTIAQIYKARWQVELFFKWIKQHLRIKAFYGTSENAVKTQIWIAVAVYVLVAIARKQLGLEVEKPLPKSEILSVTLFEKTPILQVLQPTRLPRGSAQLRQPIDSVPFIAGRLWPRIYVLRHRRWSRTAIARRLSEACSYDILRRRGRRIH